MFKDVRSTSTSFKEIWHINIHSGVNRNITFLQKLTNLKFSLLRKF